MGWDTNDSIEFYSNCRHTVDELYDSETLFLPKLLKPDMKVLDVGCACGGFYNIMKELEPAVDYTGIDYSRKMISLAQKEYPEGKFVCGDAKDLPFPIDSFDLVHSTGLCTILPAYFVALRKMYYVTNKYLLIDARLTDQLIHDDWELKIKYFDKWDGESTCPYNVIHHTVFLNQLLSGLLPRPKRIYATGYMLPPNPDSNAPFDEVCMTIILLEKAPRAYFGPTEICLDIPYDMSKDEMFSLHTWVDPKEILTKVEAL